MSLNCSWDVVEGIVLRSIQGTIKGDTRSLDYSSDRGGFAGA